MGLNLGTNALIENNGTIIFDTVQNNQTSDISYNDSTGDFTLTRAGNYFVTWWVDVDGADIFSNIILSVAVNGAPTAPGASPIITGQVTGTALLTINAAPVTISLVNVSEDTIRLASITPQANITILELTE